MGTYITASYRVKCAPEEALALLEKINRFNELADFSYVRNVIGNKGVLKANAWVRRTGPDDIDPIAFCRDLSTAYPNGRVWLHLYVNHGGFEFYDLIFSNGLMEYYAVYDIVEYRIYGTEKEHAILSGEFEDGFEECFDISSCCPYVYIEEEFNKIQDGDLNTNIC